jgi:hypothetical protein
MSPVSNQPESLKSKRVDDASTEELLSSPMTEAGGPSPKLVRPPSRPTIVEKPVPSGTATVSSSPVSPQPSAPPVPEIIVPPIEVTDGRQRPIPPPSEPTQYRAIGVVRGTYQPSEEQYTRGEMLMADGTKVEAVLLGRVMSLVKNHLKLEQEHVWVVYPRTREREETLHLQIVGVWEPENLTQNSESSDGDHSESESDESENAVVAEPAIAEPAIAEPAIAEPIEKEYVPSSEVDTDVFSIRGEIVLHEPERGNIMIKIHQVLRKKGEKEPSTKFFKLKLVGDLTGKVLGYFWDLKVKREDQDLVIQSGTSITLVMPRKYPKRPMMGTRRPGFGGGGGGGFRRSGDGPGRGGDRPFTPRSPGAVPSGPPPVRKEGAAAPAKPVIKRRDEAEAQDDAPPES